MVSREQVRKVFQLIHRRSDFEFFFDNLKTIDWLDALFQEGVFETPDAPVKHENNSVSFPFWPPAKYLARVASQDPKKILRTIQTVPITENPRIHEDFLDAALAMPADISVQLKDKVISWIDNPYQMLLSRKVAHYIVQLANNGFKAESLAVASALFDVRMDQDKAGKNGEIAFKRLYPVVRNDWEYGECLKVVAPAFGEQDKKDLILLLAEKLEKAIRLDDRLNEDEFRDHSHIWRGSIESSNQNHDYNIKDTLVNWIRDLSEQFLNERPQEAKELCREFSNSKFPIFSRFALHLARQTTDDKLIRQFILDPELFDADDVWHEYALLIQERFNLLGPNDQKALIQLIDTHQPYKKLQNGDVEELLRATERAKYNYYYMIKDHLTGDPLRHFEEMYAKFGDLDHPTFSSYSMSWTGPNSPKTVAELDQLSLDELVDYLLNWTAPTQRRLGPEPSIEGLGRELEILVGKKPAFFFSTIDKFKLPEKTYVRAIIQGFGKPLEESKIEWEPVIDYMIWACAQRDPATVEKEQDDRDSTWSWAKTAACRLLEKGLISKDHPIPFELRTKVWSVIEAGLKDSDPDVQREEKYTSDKNFYQTAINSVRGIALEAAMHYGLWVKKKFDFDGKKFSSQECPELFLELDRHLDLKIDPSKAVRAVYGRWTPWFKLLDLDWFRKNIETIYPKDTNLSDYWWAAWRAYLLFNQPYSDVFLEIQAQYDRALDELVPDPKDSSERIDTRLVQQLVTFYVLGKIDLDSKLMKKLYQKADLKQRETAIDFIGRTLTSEKKDLSNQIIERSKALWLHRLNVCRAMSKPEDRLELAEFGWWMGTKHFSEDWILDQAIETLKLCHHLTPDHLVMGRLIGLADKHPAKVAEVFKVMVDYKVSDHGFYGWLHKGEVLLRKLLKTEAKKVAEETIHKLGAYGFRDLGTLLKEANQ